MSDLLSPVPGAQGGAAPVRDGQAAGQRLKQAREAAGLHVVALAAALKVPVKKLEALEAGRTADLPDATFARALAGSVCRHLKIDPTEVLALLPQAASSRLGEDSVLNTPFRYGREGTGPTRAGQAVPSAVWIALFILLGAAVVWWAVPPASEETVRATPLEPLAPVPAAEGATSMGAGASVAEETAAAPSETAAALPVLTTSTAPNAPLAPAVTPLPAPAATPASSASDPAAAASDVLVIRTRSDSWVEVSGNGKVLLQRVVKAGESVSVGEALPLTVVVGRVDATEVLVRGQPFDLAPVARNNVARFEVK